MDYSICSIRKDLLIQNVIYSPILNQSKCSNHKKQEYIG